MTRRRAASIAVLLVVLAGLAACRSNAPTTTRATTLTIPCGSSGTTVNARWTFPTSGALNGVVYLQHGFARSAAKVDDVAKAIAARGLAVVAPDLASFGSCSINEAATRTAVADLLDGRGTDTLQASADRARSAAGLPAATLPPAVVLAGHSAGGALATAAASRLAGDSAARARLKGVVLLDPVETTDNAMRAALPGLTSVPLLTVAAAPGSCNADGSGTNRVVAGRSGFVGVRLPSGCHCDAEAASTDGLCTFACGTPKAANVAALKRLAADWADDFARGKKVDTEPYPGGTWYEQQRTAGTLVTLTGQG